MSVCFPPKVENRVKDALLNRRPLHDEGPQLLPLPSMTSLPPGGALNAHRQPNTNSAQHKESTDENASSKQYKPNWRQFSHTVRAVKNVI